MTSAENLFRGVVVVIDDEVNEKNANVSEIKRQIEAENCHVIGFESIPDEARIRNLTAASFFIVDWNLEATAATEAMAGVRGAGQIRRAAVKQLLDFLRLVREIRFSPIFIFTNEAPDDVRRELENHPDLYDKDHPSHIFVHRKAEVIKDGLFNVLSQWLSNTPSAYVLKRWELEYDQAKNALFLDFYKNSTYWPLILWETFEVDGSHPSVELGGLIGRNLLSRMTPFDFELADVSKTLERLAGDEKLKSMVRNVLEGERFLAEGRLHSGSISPGDVFKKNGTFFINIRPECDCIPRKGQASDDLQLYLLKGDALSDNNLQRRSSAQYGLYTDSDAESLVFNLTGGKTVCFKFAELTIGRWADWKKHRLGRLLPPYLTRLQQRYAAYLQRPGLTRIPKILMKTSETVEAQVVHSEEPAA